MQSTPDLFPKALLGEIAWVLLALCFDLSYVCGYTLTKLHKGKKNLKQRNFRVSQSAFELIRREKKSQERPKFWFFFRAFLFLPVAGKIWRQDQHNP